MSDLAFFQNDIPFSAYGFSHSAVMAIAIALLYCIFVAKKLSFSQNLVIGRSASAFYP